MGLTGNGCKYDNIMLLYKVFVIVIVEENKLFFLNVHFNMLSVNKKY